MSRSRGFIFENDFSRENLTEDVQLKKDGQHYYYGNLKALTDHWSKDAIGVSYSYLKNLNISEDKPYRNDYCCIRRGVIVTSPKR